MAQTILGLFRALPPARKTLVVRFLALTVVNGWLSWAVIFATVLMCSFYRHYDIELPVLTSLTFPFGMFWPVVALLISVISAVCAFTSRPSEHSLSRLLIITALAELTLFGLHLTALALPMLSLDYLMFGR